MRCCEGADGRAIVCRHRLCVYSCVCVCVCRLRYGHQERAPADAFSFVEENVFLARPQLMEDDDEVGVAFFSWELSFADDMWHI